MSNNNLNRNQKTVFLPKAIAPAGLRTYEMKPFTMGLLDVDTQRLVDSANVATDKTYQLVYKGSSKGAGNANFPDKTGAGLTIRSAEFSSIDKLHAPAALDYKGRPMVAYLGWDGISTCKTLAFPCEETFGLLIRVSGQTVRNVFGQDISEIIPFTTGCCEDCSFGEKTATTLDTIREAFETSSFYVNNYVKMEQVKSCCPTEDPFDKVDYSKFCITVCDAGDSAALADVQIQYQTLDIEVVARKGTYTTYEVCIADIELTAVDTAVDVTAGVNEFVRVDTTAAVTVTIPASTGVTDFIRVADYKGTGADSFTVTLGGAYAGTITALRGEVVLQGDGAAGWVVGTLGQAPVDFISTGTVLIDCETCPTGFTAQAASQKLLVTMAYDGVADVLTTVQGSFATATAASLIGVTAGVGTFEVLVPVAFDATVVIADVTYSKVADVAASCVQTTPTTFTWTVCGSGYKVRRTVCMMKQNNECDSSELPAVVSEYANNSDISGVAIKATNDCVTTYTMTQENNACLEDGCDTYGKDGAKFDTIPTFEGMYWDTCDCEGWTVDGNGCPVAPVVSTTDDCLGGLKFTGAMVNEEFIPCAFSINDAIEREPVIFEVSIIDVTSNQDMCNSLSVDWTVVQRGKIAEGRGDLVARQEVLSRNYDAQYYIDPKDANGILMQRKLGIEYGFDPSETYTHIDAYLTRTRLGQSAYSSATHNTNRELVKVFIPAANTAFQEEVKTFFNQIVAVKGGSKLV